MAWYRSKRVAKEPVAIGHLFKCASCNQVQMTFTAREVYRPDLLGDFAEVTKKLNEALARSSRLLAQSAPDTFLGRRTFQPFPKESDLPWLFGVGVGADRLKSRSFGSQRAVSKPLASAPAQGGSDMGENRFDRMRVVGNSQLVRDSQ